MEGSRLSSSRGNIFCHAWSRPTPKRCRQSLAAATSPLRCEADLALMEVIKIKKIHFFTPKPPKKWKQSVWDTPVCKLKICKYLSDKQITWQSTFNVFDDSYFLLFVQHPKWWRQLAFLFVKHESVGVDSPDSPFGTFPNVRWSWKILLSHLVTKTIRLSPCLLKPQQ